MKLLTVTLPDGTTGTRRTAHGYTHVVAVRSPGKPAWTAYSWHHTRAAADKKATTTRNCRWCADWEVQVVPV